MTIFDRKFEIERLSDCVLKENGWLSDLLQLWHPSGDAISRDTDQEGKKDLRLAIRNDSLNFYRAGQSVAKVRFDDEGKLQAKIHNKYVYGERGREQSYVTLTSDGYPEELGSKRLLANGSPACLDGWIANANEHVGDEKRFVDLVVARNPNIIDLEMALPAYSKKPTATRMDLVALEKVGNWWRVVFWEAKLVGDGRARCEGKGNPKVIQQLQYYTDWLDYKNHCELVASAYQNTCRLLEAFHGLAKLVNPRIEALGPGIIAAAASGAPPLLVDDEPRLLIDDRTRDNSFTEKGHLDKLRNSKLRNNKLRNTDLHVQMVQSPDQMTLETRP
ncbi:MAG: hypothetical protein M3178_07680 [Pseudomonadota bacterium]|nr:hypothetical protein [Pseudomonadota bacterium]